MSVKKIWVNVKTIICYSVPPKKNLTRIVSEETSLPRLRKAKSWIEGFAQKPFSTVPLFVVSLIESSLFSIVRRFG
jgi:hypothetical protein